MQLANETRFAPSLSLTIPAEWIAYIVVIVLSLIIRLANLDIVPLTETEAQQALAAYTVYNPHSPVSALPAASPVNFWLQLISFNLLGATELSTRLAGVVAGVIFTLMPLLFRERLGRDQTFLISLIFACSATALSASRSADPVLWTMIFALGALWALWNYWDSRSLADSLWFAGFFAALFFLGESGAWALTLIILASLALAFWWTLLNAPEERDTTGEDLILELRACFKAPAYERLAAFMLIFILIGASGFMLYPTGLNSVATLVGQAFTDFFQASVDAPFAYGLLAALLYEPLLLIFAGLSAVWLILTKSARFMERFMLCWLGLGAVLLIVYRASSPADALWLIVPAAWLTAQAGRELLANYAPSFLYRFEGDTTDESNYGWLKWLLGILFIALLLMLTVHLQSIGRGLLTLPQGSNLSLLFDRQYALVQASFIWTIITSLFIVVSFFLIGSIWGNEIAVQALGIGFFAYLLGTGIGTGWNTTVTNAANPSELWYLNTTNPDAYQLRETLFEIARRDRRGEPVFPLTIVLDASQGITDKGLLAWLVRDFPNARFVDSLQVAQRDEIILLAASQSEPELGGSYVGQRFAIQQHWSLANLQAVDWLAWYSQRRLRERVFLQDTAILWLRMDVYDHVPYDVRSQ